MNDPRIDSHRPSVLDPAEYEPVLWYALATRDPDGDPLPSEGVDCTFRNGAGGSDSHRPNGHCCVVGLLAAGVKWAHTGSTGSCSVCGTSYTYGEIWHHLPTGEHIHIGHVCAAKFDLIASWGSDIDTLKARRAAASKGARIRAERDERLAALCAEHPGLAADFEVDHYIIADIRDKARRWDISEKQVALVRKLAAEVRNPPPPERHVAAPEGRQALTGTIVSLKAHENAYGSVQKATLKVETPEGSWLVWVTCPQSLFDEAEAARQVARDAHNAEFHTLTLEQKAARVDSGERFSFPCGVDYLKGKTVTLTATITRSDDNDYFAFGKRPSKAHLR